MLGLGGKRNCWIDCWVPCRIIVGHLLLNDYTTRDTKMCRRSLRIVSFYVALFRIYIGPMANYGVSTIHIILLVIVNDI